MSTAVVFQSVAFLFPGGLDPLAAAFADSGIQSAIGLSLGNDVLTSVQLYTNFTSGIQTDSVARVLTFIVTTANAATIIAGIPALKTRMQTSAPSVMDIVTWGVSTSFG